MRNEINFYLAIFFRRFHYFALVFIIITAIAVAFAKYLPPVFDSEARLLIESSQIPDELAAPTIQTAASEELQIIEQRLMTRSNLLNIARSQNVFSDISSMSVDSVVELMKISTTIKRTAGRGQATLMTVKFSSDNGRTAANVVNEYVTLILRDNAESRANRAGNTLEFFEIEVERLGGELEIQSAEVLKFQNANTGALPDTLEYRLNQQTVLQERLGSVEREISSLVEQRRRLVEIFNATGQMGAGIALELPPEQQQLALLQADLRRALAVYSLDNPKVKLIQAQIVQQEAIVAGQPINPTAEAPQPMSILDINLADIDARVDLLNEQREQIEVRLAALQASIEKTPANSILLASLNRDYSNTQMQYNTAVDRLSKAATGERIELLSKGQRIAILDPAVVPEDPTSPNRKLIATGGAILGAGLGIGLILLLEILNGAIRRPTDITKALGITPIATVPYIRTPMELVARRASILAILALVVIGLPAILFAIHTYYLPLDLIYERIAAKIGVII